MVSPKNLTYFLGFYLGHSIVGILITFLYAWLFIRGESIYLELIKINMLFAGTIITMVEGFVFSLIYVYLYNKYYTLKIMFIINFVVVLCSLILVHVIV